MDIESLFKEIEQLKEEQKMLRSELEQYKTETDCKLKDVDEKYCLLEGKLIMLESKLNLIECNTNNILNVNEKQSEQLGRLCEKLVDGVVDTTKTKNTIDVKKWGIFGGIVTFIIIIVKNLLGL